MVDGGAEEGELSWVELEEIATRVREAVGTDLPTSDGDVVAAA